LCDIARFLTHGVILPQGAVVFLTIFLLTPLQCIALKTDKRIPQTNKFY
jgi:hypothetical protein